MAPSTESWTETSLYRLIEAKFEEPAHVVLPQVANGSGHMRVTRYADAMAMSLWPSRGLELHGFEIKVSKSDWKRELRDPEKSAPIQAYCDRWWIVAPGGVVDLAELPTTWGLFEPRKRRGKVSLHVAKQAPKLTDTKKIDRRFLAAILRRVAEHKTEKQVLAKEFNRGFQEGMAMGRNDPMLERLQQERDDLRKKIQDFERASGVRLANTWQHSAKDIGAAVRTVLDGSRRHRRQVQTMRDMASRMVEECDAVLKMKEPRPLP